MLITEIRKHHDYSIKYITQFGNSHILYDDEISGARKVLTAAALTYVAAAASSILQLLRLLLLFGDRRDD